MKMWFWVFLLFFIAIFIVVAIKIVNNKDKKNQDDDIYPRWKNVVIDL